MERVFHSVMKLSSFYYIYTILNYVCTPILNLEIYPRKDDGIKCSFYTLLNPDRLVDFDDEKLTFRETVGLNRASAAVLKVFKKIVENTCFIYNYTVY